LPENTKPFENKEFSSKIETKAILKYDLEPLSDNELLKVLELAEYF
jgi:hypothetical protein